MDPLSITASTIAVVGLVTQLAKSLTKVKRTFQNAPAEFDALVNEVSDFQIVLNEFQSVASVQADQVGHPRWNDASQILQNSRDALSKLEKIINLRLVGSHDGNGQIKVSRLAWLRSKEEVGSLRMILRDERNKLAFFVTLLTSAAVSRVHLTLQDVSMLSRDNMTNQQDFQMSMVQKLDRHERLLANLVDNNASAVPEEPGSASRSNCVSITRTGSDTTQPSVPQNEVRLRRNRHSNLLTLSTVDTVSVKLSYQREASCFQYCSCTCHSLSRIKSPTFLDQFFGSLFVGYSGLPVFASSCTEAACKRNTKTRIGVSYSFPRWFLQRALCLAMISNPRTGPDFSLRTIRLVDRYSDVFNFAIAGDIVGLKHLFKEGLASPTDIAAQAGYTPLHYAVDYEQVECCLFLLQQGADPTLAGGGQRPAGDFAWDKVLAGCLKRSTEDSWRMVFDEYTFSEHRQLTSIHKIVLGLASLDVESHLRLSTSNIDYRDSSGRTPLSWAASKGDLYNVQKLLQYGASVSIADNNKASPLHYAAKAEDPQVLRLLLESGADPNQRNYRGRTALHHAASYRGGAQHLKPLLEAGADVNAEEWTENETPMTFACDRDHAQNMAFLIENGGWLDLPRSRKPPLRAAIATKAYRTLPIVLRSGPDFSRRHENGDSILHIAAAQADQQIMDILADEAVISGLDAELKNHDGDSAMNVLKKRFDVTMGLIRSFERLIDGINVDKCTSPPRPQL